MDFLKKLISPVALKSEPAQPEAQPEPEARKTPQEPRPALQASPRPQPQAPPRPRPAPQRLEQQPQAPVWAQTAGHQPGQQPVRKQVPPELLRMTPRGASAHPVVPAGEVVSQTRLTARPAGTVQRVAAGAQPQAAHQPRPEPPAPNAQPRLSAVEVGAARPQTAPETKAASPPGSVEAHARKPQTAPDISLAFGAAGPTRYLSNAPGFWRTVWAMHPNKTKRRLRRLLLSWEKLGAYISSSSAGQEPTPAAEAAFLRTKIDIARSVGYLKLLEGAGGIAKEASQKEAHFVEFLERFPSLHSSRSSGESARRNLYYNWHLLYLFLHKMLGASPYEAYGGAGEAGGHMETVITSGRATSTGGRR